MAIRIFILVIFINLCSANLKTVHDYDINKETVENNSVKEHGSLESEAIDSQAVNRPLYNGKPRVRWIIIYVVAGVGGATLGMFLTISIYVRLGPQFFQSLWDNSRDRFSRIFDTIRGFSLRSFSFRSSEDNKKDKKKYGQLHREESFEEDDQLAEDVALKMDTSQNSDVSQAAPN